MSGLDRQTAEGAVILGNQFLWLYTDAGYGFEFLIGVIAKHG